MPRADSATAGLQERTLNLEYEPFVMFGPDWDGRLAEPPADGCADRHCWSAARPLRASPLRFSNGALAAAVRPSGRVVNAAYGGYNVRQEVVVAALWGGRLKPAALCRSMARTISSIG